MNSRTETEGKMIRFRNQWQVGNFWAQKQVKAGGEVLLDLYYSKSCFWTKAVVVFGPFG
jgi:hypothetical protein